MADDRNGDEPSTVSEAPMTSGIILPPKIRAIIDNGIHPGQMFFEIGRLYNYQKEKRAHKAQDSARARRDEHAQRAENERQERERLYPSKMFVLCPESGFIKGSVCVPGDGMSFLTVLGFILRFDWDSFSALLAVRPSEDHPSTWRC